MARALALLAAALVAATPAAPAAAADGPRPIAHDGATDGVLLGAALAAGAAAELAKPALAPARCRWCEPNALDAAARDATVWSTPARARRASDVLAFGVLPAGLVAHQLLAARRAGATREGGVDLLVIAEATALTADLTEAVKYAVARRRPRAVHAGPDAPRGPDDDLSFFSGHTSVAFALAASAGTVSTLRGYPSAPWVWGAGAALAAGTGWLRVAGDAHWLTDVLAGAAVGTAMGIALPRLLHGREAAPAAARQPLGATPVAGLVLAF
jgi:membrane-associated phospholipid phosphatase